MSPRVVPGRQEQHGQMNGAGEYNAGQDPEGARAISHLSGEPKPMGGSRPRSPRNMPEQHATISRHTVETVGMAVGRSLPSGVDAQHAIRFRCSKPVPREAGCLHWRSEKDGSDVMRRSGRSGTPETRNRVPCSDVVPVRDRLEKACANSFLRAW